MYLLGCGIYFFFLNRRFYAYGLSEFFVDYSQGFSRRGITGGILNYLIEINLITLQGFFNFLFFNYVLSLLIILLIIKNSSQRAKYGIWVFFLPSVLFFPIFDMNAFIRRDIFLVNGLLIHTLGCLAFRAGIWAVSGFTKFLKVISLPFALFLTFVHEYQLLFFAVYFYLIWFSFFPAENRKFFIKNNSVYCVSYLVVLAFSFVMNLFSAVNNQKLGFNLGNMTTIGIREFSALSLFRKSPSEQVSWTIRIFDSGSWALYILVLFVSVVACGLLTNKTPRFIIRKENLLALAPFVLMFIGCDWGRWIHFLLLAWLCMCLLRADDIRTDFYRIKFIGALFITGLLSMIRLPHCCTVQVTEMFAPAYILNILGFLPW
jgi:hypothetical protein